MLSFFERTIVDPEVEFEELHGQHQAALADFLADPEATHADLTQIMESAAKSFSYLIPDSEREVWQELKSQLYEYKAYNPPVRHVFERASDPTAIKAMQIIIDAAHWNELNYFAEKFAPEPIFPWLAQSVDYMFDPQLREAVRKLMPETREGEYDDERRDKDQWQSRAETGSSDRESEGSQHLRNAELDEIVQRAVAVKPDENWLLRADRTELRRIINTVRLARERAKAKDEILTDRDMYLRYRKSVEVGDAARHPELLNSFKIVAALMGGSPKGKLPF